jgi:hypothetical protein
MVGKTILREDKKWFISRMLQKRKEKFHNEKNLFTNLLGYVLKKQAFLHQSSNFNI